MLARTRDFWEEVRGGRLFVTGGTGFFGMWLIETFLWANQALDLNAEMVVLSRDPQAFRRRMPHLAGRPNLALYAGDVRSFDFPTGPFSHVIHAANHPYGEGNAGMLDVMVRGTRHTLDFARHCGAKKFLFASSGSVYGPQPVELSHVDEQYQVLSNVADPRFTHAHGKRLGERLCVLYDRWYGFEAKIARGFAFVGPYLPLNANYAAGNFLRDALAGEPIIVRGDGTPYRSYLYAADMTVWLWTILFRGQRCRPYNVGSSEAISIGDLAQTVATAVNPRVPVRILERREAGRPVERYVPDCRRAAEELGLRQEIGLVEGIRRTLRWHALSRRTVANAVSTVAATCPVASDRGTDPYRTTLRSCAALLASASPTGTSFSKESCNG